MRAGRYYLAFVTDRCAGTLVPLRCLIAGLGVGLLLRGKEPRAADAAP